MSSTNNPQQLETLIVTKLLPMLANYEPKERLKEILARADLSYLYTLYIAAETHKAALFRPKNARAG